MVLFGGGETKTKTKNELYFTVLFLHHPIPHHWSLLPKSYRLFTFFKHFFCERPYSRTKAQIASERKAKIKRLIVQKVSEGKQKQKETEKKKNTHTYYTIYTHISIFSDPFFSSFSLPTSHWVSLPDLFMTK